MKDTITIDGFTFEKEYNNAPDEENLNYFLENKFNKYDIKEFMSKRHPELYPHHIGLIGRKDGMLSMVMWEYKHCGSELSDHGWEYHDVKEPEKYIDDIMEFYSKNDPDFYNFIKNRLL